MCHEFCFGKFPAQGGEFFNREGFVHLAGAIPQYQVPSGGSLHIATEVSVGGKNDLLFFWQTFHDGQGVGGGTDGDVPRGEIHRAA